MSLFSIKDIPLEEAPEQKKAGVIIEPNGENSVFLGKVNSKVEEVIPTLEQNKTYHFFSSGQWSTHELLEYLLSKTGPATVSIAVWSISEIGARKLVQLKEQGLISHLQTVFDYRTNTRHPGALHLVRQACDRFRTLPCHAKITVISNPQWNICIIGSPNYTNNPRPEAGYVCTHGLVSSFYLRFINELLDNNNPFNDDNGTD